jgi:hypothetical protein
MMLMIEEKVSQTRRQLPEQPRALLFDRRERQVHATDESGSEPDDVRGVPDFAAESARDGEAEYDVIGGESK